MYSASLVVIAAVGMMLFLWGGFMVWAFHSGQLKGMDKTRRLPLEEDEPSYNEDGHG